MGKTANIACQPHRINEDSPRHSHNFNIIQLSGVEKLIWYVVSLNEEEKENIRFCVKEHYTYKDDEMRFEEIKNGTITDYMPYRNLYIADVKNAKGHFVVRVEQYSK